MKKWINKQLEMRLWRKANTAFTSAKYEKALRLFKKAQEKYKDYPELKNNIAACYFELKEYNRAIPLYEELLVNSHMDKWNIRVLLSSAYAKNGEYEKSEKIFKELLDFDERHAGIWNNYGYCCLLEKEDYRAAVDAFTKAIEIEEDFAFAYNNRGFAKLNLGDKEGAIQDVTKSLELDKSNSYAYKNRAKYYLAIGDEEMAKKDLKKAKKMGYAKLYGEEVNDILKQFNP